MTAPPPSAAENAAPENCPHCGAITASHHPEHWRYVCGTKVAGGRGADCVISCLRAQLATLQAEHDELNRLLFPEPPVGYEPNLAVALKARLKLAAKERCEHCGSDRIYHGPPDCPGCGAPNCCQTCCNIAALEAQLAAAKDEMEKAKAAYNNEYWNTIATGGVLGDVKQQLTESQAREATLRAALEKIFKLEFEDSPHHLTEGEECMMQAYSIAKAALSSTGSEFPS